MLAIAVSSAAGASPTLTTNAATEVVYTTAHASGSIDPEGNGHSISYFFEYTHNPSEGWPQFVFAGEISALEAQGTIPIPVEGTLTGLQAGAEYFVRLTVLVQGEGELNAVPSPAFTTKAVAKPVVLATTDASAVSYTSADVSGEVERPSGADPAFDANCHFEYVPDAEFVVSGFEAAAATPCDVDPITGTGATSVAAELEGLAPATTYHLRLAAQNAGGIDTREASAPFTTLAVSTPTVSIESDPGHTATTAHLVGHIDPEAPGAAPGQDPAFAVTWRFECTPACPEEGGLSGDLEADSSSHEVATDAAGLTPGTGYEIRLAAENSGGAETRQTAGPISFTTSVAAPVIASTSISAVGVTEATLNATIDPGGGPTEYHFEYVTATQFGESGFTLADRAPVPDADLGFSDNEGHGASAPITGLAAGTVYRFRVVVANTAATGGVDGPTQTFETRSTAPASSDCPNEAQRLGPSAALPDCRAFEAVSPVATEGTAQVFVPGAGAAYLTSTNEHGIQTHRPFEVAANGGELVFPADSPAVGGTGNARQDAGSAALARLDAGVGWQQRDIQPPKFTPSYNAFSTELSAGVLESVEPLASATPDEGYADLYIHDAATAGAPYLPLFAENPPDRPPAGETGFDSALLYAGANAGSGAVPAATHLLFEANDLLVGGSGALETELDAAVKANVAEGEEGRYRRILYDSVAGVPTVVNVLPDGKADADASFGSPPSRPEGAPGLDHVISADGSRIFWTDNLTHDLYLREDGGTPTATTVEVDAPESGCGTCAGGGGRFLTASNDGSKVFFIDDARLTNDSNAAPGEPDLYEYNVAAAKPTDLTVDSNSGEHANVRGILGSSEDGGYIYLVAGGVLAGNTSGHGEHAEPGAENLYLRHGEAITFIAILSRTDGNGVVPFDGSGEGGESGDWSAAAGYRTARVTPDGSDLIFLSERSLTGYENQQTAFNGVSESDVTTALDEVFLFEAGTSTLRCVSCDPSGAGPVATEYNNYRPSGGTPVGGFFPITKVENYRDQPRVITDDGARIFFDSGEPLVPQDTNGWLDVYEWEREGSGTCHRSQGCIYLLSNGTGRESSYLLGTGTGGSNPGADAFIITREQLVAADRNESFDVYDARVDGVSPPAEAQPCKGEACRQSLASSPAPQSPGTGTFSGPGNPRSVNCKKGQVNKHGKCVKKQAKKHRHHKRKGRENHNGKKPGQKHRGGK